LLRERLERAPWAQAVTQIKLLAPELHSPEIIQADLFDDSSRRTAGWKALLDKMRARIGTDAVRCLGLRDDHLPEHAWCSQQEPKETHTERPYPERPLWLLEPVRVITRPTQLTGPPERIESGWWAEGDESRDYFVVESPDGSRLWLYRDAATQEWFLQGIWA
jgi:protein ImuB